MKQNIFEEVKSMIDARDVVSSILGEPSKISGDNHFWHSPFNVGDNDPSFCVKADMISDFSTDETGQDIFNFIVNYNNNINSIVSDKEINNYEALKWLVDEFHLNVDINSYSKDSYSKDFSNKSATIKKYFLETAKTNHINDNGIYAMFDTTQYNQKPPGNEIGKIKNRISTLKPFAYSLQLVKDYLTNGQTCIPAAIKSEMDWKDDENFYQIFMVDIDNVVTENGVKQKHTIDDEKHVTVDKILDYCTSINLIPTFIYYTFSHTEQQHKFRLVYVLDIATSSKETIKGIYDFLKQKFKDYNMDNAPTSIANLFLGGQRIAFESDVFYDIGVLEETITENQEISMCNELLKDTHYFIAHEKLWLAKKKDEYIDISNFVVYADEKLNYRNGRDVETIYKVKCVLLDNPDIKLPEQNIDVENLSKFNFILGSVWDKYAIITANKSNSDRLREVFQHISRQTMQEKDIYSNIGFTKINDNLCYLYHGGALGEIENVDVDLSNDKLQQYCFTKKEFDLTEASKTSFSILNLADDEITIPLVALVYLAPLISILAEEDIHADFVMFLQGKSGTRKSSLAALLLSHFGRFNRDTFPCSFRDTLNSIEKKAYLTKDTVNVVDDFNPEIVGSRKLDTLERLFAMYGDRTGRTRMSQNGKTLNSPYVARGICLVTGETTPDVAQSRIARSLIISMKEESIDLKKLSELQSKTEQLSFCMMNYILWIIKNEEMIREDAKKKFAEFRDKQDNTVHGRTNEIANVLTIGFSFFTQFLTDNNVITNKQQLDEKAYNVLSKLVEQQSQEIVDLKPTEMFYSALEQLFATNMISLLEYETGEPAKDVSEAGTVVGYYDSNKGYYYFYPDIIFKQIENFYTSKDRKFPINKRTLWKYLEEEGYLYRTDTTRYTVQRRINKKVYTLVAIKELEIHYFGVESVRWPTPSRQSFGMRGFTF